MGLELKEAKHLKKRRARATSVQGEEDARSKKRMRRFNMNPEDMELFAFHLT
jgi:hypothetical protein